MRKIFIFFTMILSFLFLPILKVDGMTIPNTSEVKFYNLDWVYQGQGSTSDTLIYELMVEIAPDYHEPLDAIISYELEELKLYGVLVFNFPRSKSTLVDEKQIIYRLHYSSEQQVFRNVNIDYIAVKKLSNKGELYLDYDSSTHKLDYFAGSSSLEIIRFQYYIPDYSLDDAYNNGYSDGYIDGKSAADELEYERGYQEGYLEGHDAGFSSGYDKGISENIETGGFSLMLKNVFMSVGSFLELELLPGIPFGAIIAVPIVFGIIAFILGRRS